MKKEIFLTTVIILFSVILFSQKAIVSRLPFENSILQSTHHFTMMPYNRLVKSAGKVITYGDSSLENHALDLCMLPDKKNIVIEDRYGIAVMSLQSNAIISRWSFNNNNEWKTLMSSYSGITSFIYKNTFFIAWGAGIPKGIQLGNVSNLDVAPTVAALLGFEMKRAKGHAIEQIVKHGVRPPR